MQAIRERSALKGFRRIPLFTALLAAPILLCAAGRQASVGSGLAGDATAAARAAQQFYTRVEGDWVGTTVSGVNGAEPVMGYFHLVVSRVDANAFREEYTFYRSDPTTGVLERSGTESDRSTIASSGIIQRSCRGSGTILIDFKPKNQSFEASGEVHFTSPDHLEAEAEGKIAVDGMPFGAGKNGKLRKATATWSLENSKLIGQSQVEASFHVLLFSKRYRIQTQFRAQRGDNIPTVAGPVPAF